MYTPKQLDILASPFGPLASRTHRRAHVAARDRQLITVPALYPVQVGTRQAGNQMATFTLKSPQSEGPMAVTDVTFPTASGHANQTVRRRVKGEWMDDGPVFCMDGFIIPRMYSGRLSSAPSVIIGGAQIDFVVTDPGGATYQPLEGIEVMALHPRSFSANGGNGLCGPAANMGLDWANELKAGGQWWGLSLESNTPGTAEPTTITDNVVIECIVVSQKGTPVEAEANPLDIKIKIDQHDLMPGTLGPLYGPVIEGRRVAVLPGLFYPVKSKSEVTMQLTYANDVVTRLPVRLTLLGRRGGTIGQGWGC